MNDSLGATVPLLRVVPRPAPPSPVDEARRPVVVVVGPPHCGISVCAYALSLLGVDMTDAGPAHSAPNADTSLRRGRWERQPVKQFHDQILGFFNRAAAGPLCDFALPVAWWADSRVVSARHEIAAGFESGMGGGYPGFADSRAMRLLPLWRQIFAELKLSPKVVLCLRNPALAARSPDDRRPIDPDLAEYRWLVHMTDFFRYADRLDYCAVEYEDWFDNAPANLDKLQNFLGLEWQQGEADRELVLANIAARVGPATEIHGAAPRQPLVRAFYELARHAIDGGGAGGRREQIVQQFIAFQQLQRPIEKALAASAAAVIERERERDQQAAAREGLRAELASARSGLAESETALASAESRSQTLETEIALREQTEVALQARLDEAEAALSATRSERDAAGDALAKSEAARDALRALLTITRKEAEKSQLAAGERATELEAALQSAQAQLATAESARLAQVAELRAASNRSEQDSAAKADRLGREIAELRAGFAEVTARANAVAASELAAAREHELAMARERELAAERQRELAVVGARLGNAEHHLARRDAELKTMQTEIAALRRALTAARQAGRAAMQALAAAPVSAPPPERIGWLRALKRRLGFLP